MTFGDLAFGKDDGGEIAWLDVPESCHRGPDDPVPHAIRWLNERGWSAQAYQHKGLGGGRCRFTFFLARHDGEPT